MPDDIIGKFKVYIKEYVGNYSRFPQGRHTIKESEFISSLPDWEKTLDVELNSRQEERVFNWMKINGFFKPE